MQTIGGIIRAFDGEIGSAVRAIESGKSASIFGLTKSGARLLCTAFGKFLYVCADVVSARTAFVELSLHYPEAQLLLPKNNVLLPSGVDRTQGRLRALYNIACGKADVVVTTAEALMQIVPTAESFVGGGIVFEKGKTYRTDDVIKQLVAAGYTRCGHVDEPARFAVRGDILDICTIGGEAARIEFFGNECDSVRALDIAAQTAGKKTDRFTAYPACEVVYSDEAKREAVNALIRMGEKRKGNGLPIEHRLAERINSGDRDGDGTVLPLFPHTTLDKFCNLPIIIEDAKSVYDNCIFAYREHIARAKRLNEANESPYCAADNLIDKPSVVGAMVCFHAIDSANRFFSPDNVFKFKSLDLPVYGKGLSGLKSDVATWLSRGIKVYVGADIQEGMQRAEIFGVEYIAPTADGGVFFGENAIVIGMRNVGMKRDPFESIRRTGMKELPKPGDYVVHETHGIGICEAVGAVDFGGYERDYITVRYAGDDTLYVPVENIGRLSKYDFTDNAPKLNKLGGAEFDRVKTRVKTRLKAMAFDLLELYARREVAKGKTYTDNSLCDEFNADFPYSETPDQLAAIDACMDDLSRGKIMDRLICGDVGFGKTEVALRAAFKVIANGGQVAFLSPTTVLCRQHYNTTKARMEKFGVKVAAFSRAEDGTAKTLKGLADGSIDIVCGTHKLLGNSVKFKSLELLILDEEQKFGVSDKEKIKNLKADVNVLTLSATPIPRTLHMALSGMRDVTMLETPPTGRLPAQVYVTEYSDALCADAISREVERGGQVFIVYNYVNAGPAAGIAEYTGRLQALLPDIRFTYAHGQMDRRKLNTSVENFAIGKYDVLVATTIIENGIDIPNANTMIVYGAENMGLSQMYQLKGRVGRSDRVAQVYFTYGDETRLTSQALERLESIARYTDLGSGVKIAEQDMRIRGVGNVFGAEQHGHIVSVGYAMYCKLLKEAVAEIKGAAEKSHKDPTMKVDFTAVIPSGYCDAAVRIELYRRISTLSTVKERDALLKELADAYETVPTEIKNLCNVGLIKNLAAKHNATAVTLLRSGAKIEFSDVKDIPPDFEKFGGCFNAVKTPLIIFENIKSLAGYLVSAN